MTNAVDFTHNIPVGSGDYKRAHAFVVLNNVVFESVLAYYQQLSEDEQKEYQNDDGKVKWSNLFTVLAGQTSDTKLKKHIDALGMKTSDIRNAVTGKLSNQEYGIGKEDNPLTDYVGLKPQFYFNVTKNQSRIDPLHLALGYIKFTETIRIRVVAIDDTEEMQSLIVDDNFTVSSVVLEFAENGEDIVVRTRLVPPKDSNGVERVSQAVRMPELALID